MDWSTFKEVALTVLAVLALMGLFVVPNSGAKIVELWNFLRGK